MKYEQDELFDLMEEIEAQGGGHHNAMCKAKRYERPGEYGKPVTIAGCGHELLFDPGSFVDGGLIEPIKDKPFVVCAVDDDMGRWPRYGGDRFAREDA